MVVPCVHVCLHVCMCACMCAWQPACFCAWLPACELPAYVGVCLHMCGYARVVFTRTHETPQACSSAGSARCNTLRFFQCSLYGYEISQVCASSLCDPKLNSVSGCMCSFMSSVYTYETLQDRILNVGLRWIGGILKNSHTVARIDLVRPRHSLRVQQDRYALVSETSPGVPEEMKGNVHLSHCGWHRLSAIETLAQGAAGQVRTRE